MTDKHKLLRYSQSQRRLVLEKKKEKQESVSVAMNKTLVDKLKEKAEQEGRTFSQQVRYILNKHA